ncbi:MAG: RDD family protein [Verrucomicrobiae bacterium]|jgi:uncharacterized RDD family membrane protein YckC|nr:RDD family protein [Verrucomicrobiae bacterium]
MSWYYAIGQTRNGPVSDEEFESLKNTNVVTGQTLVWREGMPDWQPYAQIAGTSGGLLCASCQRPFDFLNLERVGDRFVCAACKVPYLEGIRSSGTIDTRIEYAGFWPRFAAFFLDEIIVAILMVVYIFAFGVEIDLSDFDKLKKSLESLQLAGALLSLGFFTFFVGRYGATPGKMLLGLKIVTPDGGRVSYLRAFGRWWAMQLSRLIIYIGYLMIIFDGDEHRTLHDRICETRVVRL